MGHRTSGTFYINYLRILFLKEESNIQKTHGEQVDEEDKRRNEVHNLWSKSVG